MSRAVYTLGYAIGESEEDRLRKDRAYTNETNDKLAGDNATPLPTGDVASVGFKLPKQLYKPSVEEGCDTAYRYAMADQLDDEDRLSFTRR